MATAMRTFGQSQRQSHREDSGRYEQSEPCDACSKPAGFDYWSANGTSGEGLTLCQRKRCPANKIASQFPDEAATRIAEHCRSIQQA